MQSFNNRDKTIIEQESIVIFVGNAEIRGREQAGACGEGQGRLGHHP